MTWPSRAEREAIVSSAPSPRRPVGKWVLSLILFIEVLVTTAAAYNDEWLRAIYHLIAVVWITLIIDMYLRRAR